jgi:hypothetical protein
MRAKTQGEPVVKMKESRAWNTPEFLLVIVMLGVLTVLVFLVLWADIPKF